MKPTAKIIAISTFLAFCSTSLAVELLVPTQYPTIQSAINDCNDGDTIIVAPGIYTGPGNRDIDFFGKAVTVRSTDPNNPNIVAATIINCNGTEADPHYGFSFQSGEGRNSVVSGFTITRGYWNGSGGAILCLYSSPTISKCIVKQNVCSNGVIACGGGNPILNGCTIKNNQATRIVYLVYLGSSGSLDVIDCVITENKGEGIFVQGNLTIADSVIAFNDAEGVGSLGGSLTITNSTISNNGDKGIFVYNNSAAIKNCLIERNSSSTGGAIYCVFTDSLNIESSWIINNVASNAGAIFLGFSYCRMDNCVIAGNSAERWIGGIFSSNSTAKITNCTFYGNSAGEKAGGIGCQLDDDITLYNCIFWDNSAVSGKEINLQLGNSPSRMTIGYSNIQGGIKNVFVGDRSVLDWGPGNIDPDPCFVQPGYWVDANDHNIIVEPNDPNAVWLDGDYHLLFNSPSIDTGDPNYVAEPNETDLDGKPRMFDGDRDGTAVVDMGAYEYLNTTPVAVAGPNQTVYTCLDGFADVNLDGSASFDDDNDVLDFYWSWTIGGDTYEANGVNPTIKLPVGIHTIELVVDDGIDLSEPDYCAITVIKAVRGRLSISPQVVQTRSRGKWIIATLYLPPVIGEKANATVPLRLYPSGIEAKYQYFSKNRRFGCSPTFAIAFFDRQQVIDTLGLGRFEVSVVGEFLSGRFFLGSNFIRIISPPPPPPHYRR
jgi:hypothetical protein